MGYTSGCGKYEYLCRYFAPFGIGKGYTVTTALGQEQIFTESLRGFSARWADWNFNSQSRPTRPIPPRRTTPQTARP
jgi:hypothetical protein